MPCAIAGCPGAVGVMMSGSGTSVYALASADKPMQGIENVLVEFPDVKYFQCDLVHKGAAVGDWYE